LPSSSFTQENFPSSAVIGVVLPVDVTVEGAVVDAVDDRVDVIEVDSDDVAVLDMVDVAVLLSDDVCVEVAVVLCVVISQL
jgi:hypothetical protein